MKALITGSERGFISHHVYDYLGGLGYEVDYLSRANFDFKDFSPLYGEDKPDVVVNAAWLRADLQSREHLNFANNMCEFLWYCSDAGRRVINIGSHSEYSVSGSPAKETDRCEPVTTYGLAKLMVTLYAKNLGFNTLRLSAVYGEGGRTFKDIYDRENARYAMPENVKDFVPVEQVCYAVERLIHMPHLYGEIINVSSGRQESAEEIAREIQDAESKWHLYAQRQVEPSYAVIDNEKMINLLNLKPR